ncbi:MAG TPA: biotin/lipoyl-containing protein, partial [Actinomycetota bacterium]|nr:biotin/lipoyl-containing protein [Actinomycetota bacterium]
MASREFRLPDLGEGLEDAEVVRWLVEQGQDVALNQPLVEVDTAKALVEIPSPFAGKVWLLHANEGEVVKVGSALVTFEVGEDHPAPSDTGGRTAVLVGYGAQQDSTAPRRRRLKAGKAARPDGEDDKEPEKSAGRKGAVLAAPPVRKLAAELGVDLALVTGSGPGGRISREDVQAVGAAAPMEGL